MCVTKIYILLLLPTQAYATSEIISLKNRSAMCYHNSCTHLRQTRFFCFRVCYQTSNVCKIQKNESMVLNESMILGALHQADVRQIHRLTWVHKATFCTHLRQTRFFCFRICNKTSNVCKNQNDECKWLVRMLISRTRCIILQMRVLMK